MKDDASPFIHGQKVSHDVARVAGELARIRNAKVKYDQEQRLKRDPKFKKRKSGEHKH